MIYPTIKFLTVFIFIAMISLFSFTVGYMTSNIINAGKNELNGLYTSATLTNTGSIVQKPNYPKPPNIPK